MEVYIYPIELKKAEKEEEKKPSHCPKKAALLGWAEYGQEKGKHKTHEPNQESERAPKSKRHWPLGYDTKHRERRAWCFRIPELIRRGYRARYVNLVIGKTM